MINNQYPAPEERALNEAEAAPYNHSEQYASAVNPILQGMAEHGRADLIEGYLGSGIDKHAFRAETPEGPIVVKLIKVEEDELAYGNSDRQEVLTRKTLLSATPLVRGEGAPKLEQLLSVDPHAGILVTTLAKGQRVADMTSRQLLGIKHKDLLGLQGTIAVMKERGLHPHNAGGIFFDKTDGFNFIDYELDTMAIDGHHIANRGSIDTLEGFLHYALTDFAKIDAVMELAINGRMRVTESMVATTGLRRIVRSRAMRQARKLQD